jgi:tryptophan synthase alpha chain
MAGTFETAAAFRSQSETPLVLMGYANPVVRYGIQDFCRDAAASGVDGLILPDLPPEESEELECTAADHGLSITHLVAPNTADERIRMVDSHSTGFVYAVSVTGLTGSGLGAESDTDAYLVRARALVQDNPLLVGFGIRTAEDAARLTRHTDGFIVGSALIQRAEQLWDDPALSEATRVARIADFARGLASVTHTPTS